MAVTLPTSIVQEEPAPSFKDIQDNLGVPQKPAAMAEAGKPVGQTHPQTLRTGTLSVYKDSLGEVWV